MTVAGPLGPILGHPGTSLAAAAFGVALALAYLTAEYLILPALRLRDAGRRDRGRDRASVDALIEREWRRLRRLENAAAVRGEHGRPDAKALREEAELRRLVLCFLEVKIRIR